MIEKGNNREEKVNIWFILLLSLFFFFINNFFITYCLSEWNKKEDNKKFINSELERISLDQDEKNFLVLENDYLQIVVNEDNGEMLEVNFPLNSEINNKSYVKRVMLDDQIGDIETFPLNDFKDFKKTINKKNKGGYFPLFRRYDSNLSFIPVKNFHSEKKEEELKSSCYIKEFKENSLNCYFKDTEISREIRIDQNNPYCLEMIFRNHSSKNSIFSIDIPIMEIDDISCKKTNFYYCAKSKKEYDIFKLGKFLNKTSISNGDIQWLSISGKYFAVFATLENVGSLQSIEISTVSSKDKFSRLSAINKKISDNENDEICTSMNLYIPANGTSKINFYLGPLLDDLIANYANQSSINEDAKSYLNNVSKNISDYYFTKPFFILMNIIIKYFYTIFHSWGLSLIILTFVIRVLLNYIFKNSKIDTSKMNKLKKQVDLIKLKYKDNFKAHRKIVALYKRNNMNFFSLNWTSTILQACCIFVVFEIVKSSFMIRGDIFIPNFIEDLSAPDNFLIPYFNVKIHLLPFIVFLLAPRFLFNKKNGLEDSSTGNSLFFQLILGIILVFVFYNSPAGVNLCILTSMIANIFKISKK